MKDATRRQFLGAAALSAAGAAAAEPPVTDPMGALPTVKFREHEITRLIIGSNPFYGYSHFNPLFDRFMREYYTQDKRIEVLKAAERAGINTWQVHYNDPTVEDWKRYRAEGGKMKVLLLADFALMKDWKLMTEVAKLKPIGVGHHGNRTDERFRTGQMNIVRDFTKAVHDAGMPAGVSMHNPEVLAYIEEHGWELEYYQTCLYRVSRTVEEARAEFGGEAPLTEIYMEKDPAADGGDGAADQKDLLRIQAVRRRTHGGQSAAGGKRLQLRAAQHQAAGSGDCRHVPEVPRPGDRERHPCEEDLGRTGG